MTGRDVPTHWRSVLPYLSESLPSNHTEADDGLPPELRWQAVQEREYWPIPEPVRDAYAGYRRTRLWRATAYEQAVGARMPIYAKYEGANIAGSHKLNTALAQAYYYQRAGVQELVTGTGIGNWGTALAAACALFGLGCTVFVVESSLRSRPYHGALMQMLGATVHASPSDLSKVAARRGGPSSGPAVAIGEAVAYAAGRADAAFCAGGGATYSILHQSVIGIEAQAQLSELDVVVGTVVGSVVDTGSNFGGIALPFLAEARATGIAPPALVAAGPNAPDERHACDRATVAAVISALRHSGEISATAADQVDALSAGRLFTLSETIVPAPESGYALAVAARLAADERTEHAVLVCVSGHGYLDLDTYRQYLTGEPHTSPAP